jgi:hypothetical protein
VGSEHIQLTEHAMYVECDTVVRSRNHCFHGNATCSLRIVVYLHVAVSNIKPLSVSMEMQWVPFAMLSRYKVHHTAVNNKNVLRSSCKVADTIVRLEPNLEFLDKFS